jgi:beta-lactamase class A
MKTFLALAFFCSTLGAAQPENLRIVRANTEARIQEVIRNAKGALGFVAFDLVHGDRFAANEHLVFPQASAIKIPILMEVFRQAASNRLKLSDMLWVEKNTQVGGSGVLFELGDRTSQLSVRDLCVLMILLSDNTATNMLIDRVGMANINIMLNGLGMKETKVQRRMLDPAASARGEENLSTPAEAARIMQLLHDGEFVSRSVSDEIIAILKKPKGEMGAIQAGVPNDIAVAFKPGAISGVNTEWAIVYLPNLQYVLVVMENYGVGNKSTASMTKISQLLFEYYSRVATATKYGTYVAPASGK